MLWEDALINKNITNEDLVSTFATLFSISPTEVMVINDITTNNVREGIKVLIVRETVKGDFCLKISIYIRDNKLEHLNSQDVIGHFCDMLECACLIADNTDNPYSMILITGTNAYQSVFLVPENLDDRDEYVIETSEM